MPNGDNQYNYDWCSDKHRRIDNTFSDVWESIRALDKKLWGIIVLLLVNAGGIIGILIKS
jgi:hypothetical protein